MLNDSYKKNFFLFQTTQTILIDCAGRWLENLALDGCVFHLELVNQWLQMLLNSLVFAYLLSP